MALASSQIYVATYSAPSERGQPTSNTRNRGPELPPISRWRFGRSSTNLRESGSDSRSSSSTGRSASIRRAVSPAPSVPKLEKSASKMSLFSLFSRPKVETARGHTEVGLAVPMRPQTPPRTTPQVAAPKSSLRQNPSPPAQQSVRSRSSQMFRPMSMRPLPPPKEFGTWEPPPLFQAFPQSVKHATVQACVFAPEVLMRTQSQRRQAEILRERMDSTRDLSVIAEDGGAEAKRLEKTHRRLISNSVLNPAAPELVNKIYILVTAGYVLQYAGEGSFDRLPEKVLKLGKESAAFACDLIPGKHWVLQISSHASDDGSVEAGPKNSLISRLRSQNAAVRRAATSFLLVLESGEEMDAWMTVVRKEIDNQGGMKAKDESSRASSSTDDTRDTKSSDTTNYRYHVQRDSKMPSKIGPVDSPLQSQYNSPQIVTSEWDSSRSERTSIAESSSGQSSRYGNHRQSAEVSSLATTPVSVDQVQLDSLRGRSRFSFMSSATSLSGPGTRNTSRESSPGPQSPLNESPPAVDSEPRSAMSLKSFHMNPNNSLASRRRSMQPLPVTNEHFAPVELELPPRQRHSLFGPASPKMTDVELPATVRDVLPIAAPSFKPLPAAPESPVVPAVSVVRPSRPYVRTSILNHAPVTAQTYTPREPSPEKTNSRSNSNPPRRDLVSPPPRSPAPLPPPSANRQSVMGNSPVLPMRLSMSASTLSEARTQRRLSATPKPFLRPFPVRPQQQHAEQSAPIQRRMSSMTPTSNAPPFHLHMNPTRSVTAPVRPPSASSSYSPTFNPGTKHPASTTHSRRQSVQGRTSPAPFLLSSNRPIRAVASTPSFVPGKRSSNPPLPSPTRDSVSPTSRMSPEPQEQQQPPIIGRSRSPSAQAMPPPSRTSPEPQGQQQPIVGRRRSPSALALPPPMPPPNMPLPTLPPNMVLPPLNSLPPVVALPAPPMMRGPPPNGPLPRTPSQ